MEKRSLICIICPVSCTLEVALRDDGVIEVSGNECRRGARYAQREITDPVRVVTTTVRVKGGEVRRLPVRSDTEVPKHLVRQVVEYLNNVEVSAPVEAGQVLVNNVLGTGANIISCRRLT